MRPTREVAADMAEKLAAIFASGDAAAVLAAKGLLVTIIGRSEWDDPARPAYGLAVPAMMD